MTGSVTLTAAMRANLASLQGTALLMGDTQLKLATGLKVNSALDNPSSFFAAQGVSRNADDLTSLLDGMAQNIQTLKAASNGIASITTLVSQAKAVAQTALTQAAPPGVITGTVSLTPAVQAALGGAANTIVITTSGGKVSAALTYASTITALTTAINTDVGLAGTVTASLVQDPLVIGNVFLKISTNDGSQVKATGVAAAAAFGWTNDTYTTNTADMSAQQSQFNAIRTQIDQMAGDSGYRGVNLLGGINATAMKTQFNAGNTSKLTTAGVDESTAAGTGLAIAAAAWLNSTANVNTSITALDAALTKLTKDASNLGNDLAIIQGRSDFSNAMIGTLRDGANQLTVADKNTEGANMLALQTAQQLGIQALSLASQANQSVLRLFQ